MSLDVRGDRDPWEAMSDAAKSLGMSLSELQGAFSKLGESLNQSLGEMVHAASSQLKSCEQKIFVDDTGSNSYVHETSSNVFSFYQDNSRVDFVVSANPAFYASSGPDLVACANPAAQVSAGDQAPDANGVPCRKRAISLGGVK